MRRPGVTVLIALAVIVSTGGIASAEPAGLQAEQSAECSYPLEITDATGETVTIEEEPDRVVAIAPSAAQTLWAIGAADKVVGLPQGYTTAYLNGTEGKTDVLNSEFQPITEEIVDLEPDLVLAANINNNETVNNLRQQGLTVVRFEQASSIDDVAAKTRLTGRLVGNCEEAQQVNEEMNATVEQVRNEAANRENPTVYYALGGGYTAGPNTFIGDVIATAGGENIATAANIQTYGQISEEVIVAEDPDWIITTSRRNVRYGPAINSTTAVQEGQIITVNVNYMNQPGPRITRPLQTISDAFAAAADTDEPTTTPSVTETTTTATTSTAADTTTETTTDAGDTGSGFGPGFGVAAALVALAASVLLARRQH